MRWGASDDGRFALIKVVLSGGAAGFHTLPAGQAYADGLEAALILPGQVAILSQESLTLAATSLIDRAYPPVSRGAH
jgi:hypothetical protein